MTKTDWEIGEAALERRVDRRARLINIDVHDGKVILSGIVHSLAERRSVVAAAEGTSGVRSVDDRLSIAPLCCCDADADAPTPSSFEPGGRHSTEATGEGVTAE